MDATRLFGKYGWTLNLALIAAIAYVIGSGFNAYVRAKVGNGPEIAEFQYEKKKDDSMGRAPSVGSIVKRDLFQAAAGKDDAVDVTPGDTSGEIQETSLKLELLGIAYYGEDSPANLATIIDVKEKSTGLYRKGDPVIEKARIHAIEMDRVLLARNDGEVEELLLDEKQDTRPERKRPERPSHIKERPGFMRPPERDKDNYSDRIKSTGETSFVVQRSAIEDAMGNLNSLLTQAKLKPYFHQGDDQNMAGFEIVVKRGSVFEQLGIRTGDIIQSINGQDANVENGLKLLQSLSQFDQFNIEIIRAGVPTDLTYTVE